MSAELELIRPDWPAPSAVQAVVTTRAGGVSAAPYDSLNLGAHVGDDAANVVENRRRLRAALALGTEPAWLNQQHGVNVAAPGRGSIPDSADAAVAFGQGTICAVLTADCLPVFLCDRAGTRVGIAHAGWRGLAAGVIEAAIRALECDPSGLLAWLGPAIGPADYEVGDEVRDSLVGADAAATAAFARNARGRWQADLYALARSRLRRAGVQVVHGGDASTHAEPHRYFSHRRDGPCGRMASLIWLSN